MRAVLFDLDGVFVESHQVWFHVMRAIARKFGYPDITPQQMQRAWGQGIAEDARIFYPGLSVRELEHEYNLLFPQNLAHLAVEPDGAVTVAALRANRILVGVVTNSPAAVARAMLERAQIASDVLVCGTDVSEPKPAPDGILKALTLLDVSVHDAVYIGDTKFDREAARRAAIGFVGYRIDGDARIETLREVVGLCLPDTGN